MSARRADPNLEPNPSLVAMDGRMETSSMTNDGGDQSDRKISSWSPVLMQVAVFLIQNIDQIVEIQTRKIDFQYLTRIA
jgi:hypothetical protein